MAGRITLLRSTDDGLGSVNRRVLFWYTIIPAITDAASNVIAPQSSDQITRDTSAVRYITTQDQDAINAGAAGFEIVDRLHTAGETLAQFRNRLLAEHTARQAAWIQARRDEVSSAGTSVV